jgi:hypothetical protein
MTKTMIAGGALALMLVALFALVAHRAPKQPLEPDPEPVAEAVPRAHPGFIFGRVTTDDGAIYEGRLRFGGDEEAFWGDFFNGAKEENPWVAHIPPAKLKESRPLEIFGIEVFRSERQVNLARPFMVRFGDIARIEPRGRDLRVTLKSGTLYHLDLYGADDVADGVRVWDARRGVVDLDEGQIRTIELLASEAGTPSDRLHGTVRTRGGDFSGFIQWAREKSIGSDELVGHTADGELRLRFDAVRSIARKSSESDSSLVTLLNGKEIEVSETHEGGIGNLRIYVEDRRYGRASISWDVFERVDFSPGGTGPAYGDFPAGSPLAGEVTTRDGRRLAGRLVYDLDESETTETLDASSQGGNVDYNVLFGLIASIALPAPEEQGAKRAKLTLHSREVLQLELAGDLGGGNAGMLIFVNGSKQPEYLGWTDIRQIRFDRPPAMYPPLERQ